MSMMTLFVCDKDKGSLAIMKVSLLIMLITVFWRLEAIALQSSNVFEAKEYGLAIVPPDGWILDKSYSKDLTDLERRDHKDAMAFFFFDSERKESTGFSLTISLMPPNPLFRGIGGKQEFFKKIRNQMGPTDRIIKTEELTIDGQPAAQATVCVGHGNSKECQLVYHTTYIIGGNSDIRIQFTVFANLYSQYVQTFEKSLSTIRINSKVTPPMTSKCMESEIQEIERRWQAGRTLFGQTDIKWEVILKNTGSYPCTVAVAFELLDREKKVLFSHDQSREFGSEQIIEPQGSRIFKGIDVLKKENLSQVASDRVRVTKIE